MTLFDVTVDNKDTMFRETFRIFATTKRNAMIKGIKMARLCPTRYHAEGYKDTVTCVFDYGNLKGELFAIAKVVR
tara:strand:- start:8996 stop:9220 length:225 start_codon:yes stop_codon:yes gene_type:complete